MTNDPNLPLDASMLDGLPDPVFLVDLKHIVVDFNRAARQLLGADAIGYKIDELLDSSHILGAIDTTLGGQPGTRSEVFLPYPIARYYELNVWRLPDLKSPGPAWAMIVLHDVTAAQMAAQMRADFVANVSHELRSPLSSLLGFIETLQGPARDDQEATDRFLEIMETEAQRMARLINDLLALSKLETEEHIRPEEPIKLSPILTQIANIHMVRAEERGMNITINQVDKNLSVLGDSDELTQVFQNLVSNAISYGYPETEISITVSEKPILASGAPGICVTVSNQGDGIPTEDLPRLTERFYRVDKGRSRSMGGTGLGLAIVKHIVARHRGQLDIESIPGKETTFSICLPAS
jgi:two-component system, OmpR family, phosphate regulon sensor histidine kinase PhoR